MTKISVACLQLEAVDLARAGEALERALSMSDEAGQSQPDLMVLPECAYWRTINFKSLRRINNA
jgi:predicted amidohydrolase